MTDLYDLAFARNLSGGNAPAVLIEKTVTANGTYSAEDDSADGYSKVTANVPNTYTAGDEGKVVSNGQLTAQTTTTITANGTVNTTTVREVTVDVKENYNINGTLTPNSSGAYIFPQNFDWSKSWEIGVVVQKIAATMNSDAFICGAGNVTHGYGCPKWNMNDESIGLYAPYSTSSDRDGLGVYFDSPLVRGKAYWCKAGYEGNATNKIYIEMSEDGIHFTRIGEKVITFTPVYDQNVTFSLGGIYNSAGSLIKPYAEIPLNTVYIKIDGQIAWGRSWS